MEIVAFSPRGQNEDRKRVKPSLFNIRKHVYSELELCHRLLAEHLKKGSICYAVLDFNDKDYLF